jgi:hypothetical protein
MAARFSLGSARSISKEGTLLRDAQQRFVLMRGVNFGGRSKAAPYLPIMPLNVSSLNPVQFQAELQAVQPYLDIMLQLGFNVVRLLVIWKALEPRPNPTLSQLLPEGVQYLSTPKPCSSLSRV